MFLSFEKDGIQENVERKNSKIFSLKSVNTRACRNTSQRFVLIKANRERGKEGIKRIARFHEGISLFFSRRKAVSEETIGEEIVGIGEKKRLLTGIR